MTLLKVLGPLPAPRATISCPQGRLAFGLCCLRVINLQGQFFLLISPSAFVLSHSGPFCTFVPATCVSLQDTGWGAGALSLRGHRQALGPQLSLPVCLASLSPSGIPPTYVPTERDGETNEKGVGNNEECIECPGLLEERCLFKALLIFWGEQQHCFHPRTIVHLPSHWSVETFSFLNDRSASPMAS